VQDKQQPTCSVSGGSYSLDATCSANFTGSFSASDNCGVQSSSTTPAQGSLVSMASNSYPYTITVSGSVTDIYGNTGSCTGMITFLDSINPTFTSCPSGSSADADGSCHAGIPGVASTDYATDNCKLSMVTQSPPAGIPMGLGNHSIECIFNRRLYYTLRS
jgi:hypothetical protein